MNYCTLCGQKRVEGEVHVCQEMTTAPKVGQPTGNVGNPAAPEAGQPTANWSNPAAPEAGQPTANWGNPAAPGVGQPTGNWGNPAAPEAGQPTGNWGNSVAPSVAMLDFNRMLTLLKNPQRASLLQPSQDVLYGIIGIVVAILGFMVWVWMIGKKVEDMLSGIFGGLYQYADFEGASNSFSSAVLGRIFVLALISVAALFGTLWLTSNWRGNRKLSAKDLITYFGGAQFTFAAGFILAGLCTLVNIRLSFFILVVNMLTALAMNIILASENSEVSKERKFSFVAASMALYIILVVLLAAIIM